jgi:hypothetical protein
MNDKAYTFHSDPAHGWLEVTSSDLELVGLSIKDISPYSFRKGTRLFLEEDCDASKFWTAFKSKFGHAPIRVEKYTNGDFPEDNRLNGIHS